MTQNDIIQHFKHNGNEWSPHSVLKSLCSGSIQYKMSDVLIHRDVPNGKTSRRQYRLKESTYKEVTS